MLTTSASAPLWAGRTRAVTAKLPLFRTFSRLLALIASDPPEPSFSARRPCAVDQFFTGWISMYLSSIFISLYRSTMSCQPQGVSSLTSHLPPWEPPQGPLKRLFAQRVTGQMPSVLSRMQLPQPRQRSAQTPCSSATPSKVVLTAGNTRLS